MALVVKPPQPSGKIFFGFSSGVSGSSTGLRFLPCVFVFSLLVFCGVFTAALAEPVGGSKWTTASGIGFTPAEPVGVSEWATASGIGFTWTAVGHVLCVLEDDVVDTSGTSPCKGVIDASTWLHINTSRPQRLKQRGTYIYIYMTQIAAILLLHGQMARVGPESFKGFAWDTSHFNALQRCKRKMPNGSNQKLSSTNLLPITSQYH